MLETLNLSPMKLKASSNVAQTFKSWLAKSEVLSVQILQRRHGKPLDIDALWEETRENLEARDDYLINLIYNPS
jgi:hypothetical protein